MPDLTIVLGLLALIFMVAAIVSNVVERAPVSFPMIFLGIGFALGGYGLKVLQINLHDPALQTIATLNLAFVFFLDAINLRFDFIQKNWRVPLLSLGPGTLITLVLISAAAYLVLRFSILQALLVGTVLSSVDPVLLRDVVRDERISRSLRESLKIEAGSNDLIVLPTLLILTAVALGQTSSAGGWLSYLARLFLLGPVVGAAFGIGAAFLMQWLRTRTTIGRPYRAIYGIGVLLGAYTLGTLVGGSGFLAVFAAGLATALMDYDICDCFLEYSEITSEMMMLLAFLLFGIVLSDIIGTIAILPVLGFTLIVLLVARPLAIGVVLQKANISKQARIFIGWFGPRGLSTLLFGLLLVTDGVPGGEKILATAGVVVIISVVAHGVSASPIAAHYARIVAKETLPEERVGTAAGLYVPKPGDAPRVTVQELADNLASSSPSLVLDVRSRSSYDRAVEQIPGSIRVLPDRILEWAEGRPKDQEIITYCT